MSQCRQNLGRHEALIVFTLIHIGTVLSDFSNVFKSLFHDITPVFTHGSNHKGSSITQIVKNLRLYFLWEFIERWCACKGEYLSVCSKSIFLFCNSAEMYIYANLQILCHCHHRKDDNCKYDVLGMPSVVIFFLNYPIP